MSGRLIVVAAGLIIDAGRTFEERLAAHTYHGTTLIADPSVLLLE